MKRRIMIICFSILFVVSLNAESVQDILNKARDGYYKSIESEIKSQKEAERLEKEKMLKESKARKEAERLEKENMTKENKVKKTVENKESIKDLEEDKVMNEVEVVKETKPKPKTKLEKIKANRDKAIEKIDFYERVVRSVAREEEELKEYNKNIKKK